MTNKMNKALEKRKIIPKFKLALPMLSTAVTPAEFTTLPNSDRDSRLLTHSSPNAKLGALTSLNSGRSYKASMDLDAAHMSFNKTHSSSPNVRNLETALERTKRTYENQLNYMQEYINFLKRKLRTPTAHLDDEFSKFFEDKSLLNNLKDEIDRQNEKILSKDNEIGYLLEELCEKQAQIDYLNKRVEILESSDRRRLSEISGETTVLIEKELKAYLRQIEDLESHCIELKTENMKKQKENEYLIGEAKEHEEVIIQRSMETLKSKFNKKINQHLSDYEMVLKGINENVRICENKVEGLVKGFQCIKKELKEGGRLKSVIDELEQKVNEKDQLIEKGIYLNREEIYKKNHCIQELTKENTEISRKIQKLKERTEEISMQNDEKAKKISEIHSELLQKSEKVDKLNKVIIDQGDEVKSLKTYLRQTESQIKLLELSKSNLESSIFNQLSKENSLKAEIEALKQALAESEAQLSKISDTHSDCISELKLLKTSLALKCSSIEELEKVISVQSSSLEKLIVSNKSYSEKLKSQSESLKLFETKESEQLNFLTELEERAQKLEQDLADSLDNIEELTTLMKSQSLGHEHELQVITQEKSGLISSLSELQRLKDADQKRFHEKLTEKDKTITQYLNELSNSKTSNDLLSSDLSALKLKKSEADTSQRLLILQLTDTINSQKLAESKLKREFSELSSINLELKKRLGDIDNEVNKLSEKNSELIEKIEMSKIEELNKNLKIEELIGMKAELEKRIEKTVEESQLIKAEVENECRRGKDKEMELNDRVNKMKKEIEELKDQIQRKNREICEKENEEYEQRVRFLGEINELKAKVREKDAQVVKANGKMNELLEQIQEENEKSGKLGSDSDIKDRKIIELKASLAELLEKVKGMKLEEAKVAETVEMQKKQIREIELKNTQGNNKLSQQEALMNELRASIESLKKIIITKESELHDSLSQINLLKKRLEKQAFEFQEFKLSALRAQNSLKDLNSSLQDSLEQNIHLNRLKETESIRILEEEKIELLASIEEVSQALKNSRAELEAATHSKNEQISGLIKEIDEHRNASQRLKIALKEYEANAEKEKLAFEKSENEHNNQINYLNKLLREKELELKDTFESKCELDRLNAKISKTKKNIEIKASESSEEVFRLQKILKEKEDESNLLQETIRKLKYKIEDEINKSSLIESRAKILTEENLRIKESIVQMSTEHSLIVEQQKSEASSIINSLKSENHLIKNEIQLLQEEFNAYQQESSENKSELVKSNSKLLEDIKSLQIKELALLKELNESKNDIIELQTNNEKIDEKINSLCEENNTLRVRLEENKRNYKQGEESNRNLIEELEKSITEKERYFEHSIRDYENTIAGLEEASLLIAKSSENYQSEIVELTEKVSSLLEKLRMQEEQKKILDEAIIIKEKTISELISNLKVSEAHVSNLAGDLNEFKAMSKAKESDLQMKLSTIQSNSNTQIQELRFLTESLQNKNLELKTQSVKDNELVDELRSHVQSLNAVNLKDKGILEQKILDLNCLIQSSNQQLKELKSSNEIIIQKALIDKQAMETIINQVTLELQESKLQISRLSNKIAAYTKEANEKSIESEQISNKLSESQTLIRKQEEELKNLNQIITNLKDQHSKEIKILKSSVLQSQEILETHKNQFNELLELNDKLKKEILTRQAEYNKLETELINKVNELKSLGEQLKESLSRERNLKLNIEEINKNNAKLQKIIDIKDFTIKNEEEENKINIHLVEKQRAEIEKLLNELKEIEDRQDSTEKSLKKALAEMTSKKTEALKSLLQVSAELDKEKERNKQLEISKSKIHSEFSEQSSKAAKELRETKSSLAELIESRSALEKSYNELALLVGKLQKEKESLTSSNEALKSSLSESKKKIASYDKQAFQVTKTQAAEIENLKKLLSEATEAVQPKEEALKSISSELNTSKSTIAQLVAEKSVLESTVQALQEENTKSIKRQKDSFSKSSKRIAELEAQSSQLVREISGLTSEITNTKASFSKERSNFESQLSDKDKKLSVQAQKFGRLSEEFQEKKTEIEAKNEEIFNRKLEMQKLSEDNERFIRELRALETLKIEFDSELKEKVEKIEEITRKCEYIQKELNETVARNHELEAELKTLTEKEFESSDLRSEASIDSVKQDYKRLHRTLTTLKSNKSRERYETNKILSQKSQDLKNLIDDVGSAKEELQKTKQQLREKEQIIVRLRNLNFATVDGLQKAKEVLAKVTFYLI